MQEITALLITLALLAATLAWLRRSSGDRSGRRIEALETLTLAPGRTLALVRVDDRRLLVAVGREAVSLVAELSPATSPAPMPEPAEPQPVARAAASSSS